MDSSFSQLVAGISYINQYRRPQFPFSLSLSLVISLSTHTHTLACPGASHPYAAAGPLDGTLQYLRPRPRRRSRHHPNRHLSHGGVFDRTSEHGLPHQLRRDRDHREPHSCTQGYLQPQPIAESLAPRQGLTRDAHTAERHRQVPNGAFEIRRATSALSSYSPESITSKASSHSKPGSEPRPPTTTGFSSAPPRAAPAFSPEPTSLKRVSTLSNPSNPSPRLPTTSLATRRGPA